MDNQISEKIPILRSARQGDPISPNLFTTTVQQVFKNDQLENKGINIDGEKLSDLRCADGVALKTEGIKDMEHQFNNVNEKKLKDGSQDI